MQEIVWLLLPVAAASGWWAAMRSVRHKRAQQHEHNPVYFRGLNHLLNEEPDKAIDVFVEMLEVDSDTVETHLALGNLFRRRGEVERAIRIHQNLIARPALTTEQRGQALLELGQDYLRAGLYDRAENLFKELHQAKQHVGPALRNLLFIYQQEREWESCLETVLGLQRHTGEDRSEEQAQYYCELAVRAEHDGKSRQAEKYLREALEVDRKCVRASHMLARIASAQGRTDEALRLLRQTVEQQPDYLPEVLDEIVEAFRAQGQGEELRLFLQEMASHHPDQGVELHLVGLIREQQGVSAAIEYLDKYLSRTPSLMGLMRLLELQCKQPGGQNEGLLQQVRNQLQQLVRERAAYQCAKCGFEAKTMHWQCPSCHTWNSLKRRNV